MKLKKVKYYIQKGIIAILAIFSLLTLCFSLLRVEYVSPTLNENGFDFMSFSSVLIPENSHWAIELIGAFSILITVFAILAIILAVCNFLSLQNTKIYDIVIISIAIFNTLIYLIEGIVFKKIFIDSYGISDATKIIKTSSFVPFIICAVLIITYIVLGVIFTRLINTQDDSIDNDKGEQISKPQEESNSSEKEASMNDEETKIELITKYKKLFDDGILSQEEFETKKKQILGL